MRFLILLTLVLSFNSVFAEYSSCTDKNKKNKSVAVLLGMSSDRVNDVGIKSASVDIEKFKKMAQIINRPDSIQTILPEQNDFNHYSLKESILKKMAKIKEGHLKDTDFHFYYSGHGVLCVDQKDKKEHWCLVAGTQFITESFFNQLDEADKNQYFEISDYDSLKMKWRKTYMLKGLLITEEELMNSLGPKSMYLDSCHSGKVAEVVVNRKNSINTSKGIFVFASTIANQVASDEGNGGYFTSTLFNMLTHFDPSLACLMDWNGRGEISENALVMAVMLAFVPEKISLSPISLESSEWESLSNESVQMVESNSSDNCLLKQNVKCPLKNKIEKMKKTECEYLEEKYNNVSVEINAMLKQRNKFRKYVPKEFVIESNKEVGPMTDKNIARNIKKLTQNIFSEYNQKCPLNSPKECKILKASKENKNTVESLIHNTQEVLIHKKER